MKPRRIPFFSPVLRRRVPWRPARQTGPEHAAARRDSIYKELVEINTSDTPARQRETKAAEIVSPRRG